MVAGNLVDLVLVRARDSGATVTSRAEVRTVGTAVQRLLNAKFGLVISDVSFPTLAYQCVYPIAALAATALRVVEVADGNRNLQEVEWKSFWWVSRGWPRKTAAAHSCYALVGRDMIVIWPAKVIPASVTLRTAVVTSDLVTDDVAIQLPTDYEPLLTDLTLAVVLTKMRMYAPMESLTESIKARMAAPVGAGR